MKKAPFLIYLFLISICAFPQGKAHREIISFTTVDSSKEGDETIATVGNVRISAKEFIYGYEFGPAFVKREKDSKKKYLNFLINEKLLALDGYSRGLDKRDEFKTYASAIKGDLVTEELYIDDIMKRTNVSEDEIENGANQKLITLKIKWLYADSENGIKEFQDKLKAGYSFDSLFSAQLNDKIFADQRSMEVDRFNLGDKNPGFAAIVDSLKINQISLPIHTPDGWYIVRVENLYREVIPNETEVIKNKYDAKQAIARNKMDSASAVYVNAIMNGQNPVIQRGAFTILRSYIAKYSLPDDKYKEWNLEKRLNAVLDSLKLKNKDDYKNLELVKMNKSSITLNDFLLWFQFRSENIKLNQTTLKGFSVSLENVVWRMVRDGLLSEIALSRGYENRESVKEQSRWWNDKIMFAVVRDELGQSLSVADEIKTGKNNDEKSDVEFTKKLLHKVNKLKQTTKIEINEKLFSKIKVDAENDKRAIETYTVKPGGSFPRPAYPSIDLYWKSWE
jgi:hypothetical protein